jgi:hypothetical protein
MSATAGATLLSSYGSENIEIDKLINNISGTHKINFFKSVYMPHMKFATVPKLVNFKGSFGFGKKVKANISHDGTGDLLSNTYLCITLPALKYTNANNVILPFDDSQGGWTNSIGHALIKKVELELDNQIIDTYNSVWSDIYNELTIDESKAISFDSMIGKEDTITNLDGNAEFEKKIMVPLHFFFNKNYGSALPILATHGSSINIVVTFRPFTQCFYLKDGVTIEPTFSEIVNAQLLAEYIYLDIVTRKKWANSDHTYLVETLQYSGGQDVHPTNTQCKVDLNFSNPVKELFWVIQEKDSITNNDFFNYSRRNQDAVFDLKSPQSLFLKDCSISANNTDIAPVLDELYYRNVQSYMKHTRGSNKHIYSYSFAGYPEKLQPSGNLNFTQYDENNIKLNITINPPPIRITLDPVTGTVTSNLTYASKELIVHVYAVTNNIFIIKNGKAGLQFFH